MEQSENMFPIADPTVRDNLPETHNLTMITPFEDPSLAYSLVLPKGWVMEDDMGEQQGGVGHLVRMGLFAEKVGADAAIIQVSFSKVPVEINVFDWVQYQAARTGVDLVYCQHCDFASGPGVDAGGYTSPKENPHVVRIFGQADSARIFLVMGMVVGSRYETMKRDIAIATNSFKLAHPSGSSLLEQCLDITVSDPDFHVSYPATWEPRPVEAEVEGKSGLDLSLAKDDKMMAYLRVKAVDQLIAGTDSEQELMKTAAEELLESGITFGTVWQADPDPSVNMVEDLRGAYIAVGKLGETNVELRLGLVDREGLSFAMTLLSVLRNDDPVLWMRSKRAYEIALASADREGHAPEKLPESE